MSFYSASLCASASLRELVLVAAEGRAKFFASFVVKSPGFPPSRESQEEHLRASAFICGSHAVVGRQLSVLSWKSV
jgi:hypothetical protein